MRFNLIPLVGGALLCASSAVAGGFQVNLAAQKNIGMGHVGTGLALDQGSIFFNPGALSHVAQRGVMLGVSLPLARTAYRDEAGQEFNFEHDPTTPAEFYASFGGKDSKLRFGVGAYTPFGSKLNYGEDWTGKYVLTSINLASGFIQPTLSYKVTDWLGIGGGFVYGLGYVELKKDLPIQTNKPNPANIVLETQSLAKGYGFNAGIYIKPTDMISLGVSYRSEVKMKVEGDNGEVRYNNLPDNAPAVQNAFTAKHFTAEIPLPSTLSVGVGIMPTEKLTIGFDANFTNWSSYKELRFDYTDGLIGGKDNTVSIRNYKNSYTLRGGVQYDVAEALTLRVGGYYDTTPVPDGYITPETPDANRYAGTAGASIRFGEHFSADLSFEFLDFKERSQTQSDLVKNGADIAADRVAGRYKTQIVIPGIGLNFTY